MRLKENTLFIVADSNGQITGGETGLYDRDTRFVSHLEWRINGASPMMLSTHSAEPFRFTQHGTEPQLGPTAQLEFRRKGWLTGGTYEETVRVKPQTARHAHPLWARNGLERVFLELHLDADFADIFEVRGLPTLFKAVKLTPSESGLVYDYLGSDGVPRTTRIEIEPMGELFEVQLEHSADAIKTIDLVSANDDTSPTERVNTARGLRWNVSDDGLKLRLRVTMLQAGSARAAKTSEEFSEEYRIWRERSRVHFGNPLIQRVFDRSSQDLRSLVFDTPYGQIPAAGIPWYVTPFGRDPIITALFTMPWYPSLGKGTLEYLAARQGKVLDPKTLEAPGKILHEERDGEAARTGRIPFQRYFATADATPLWICLLGDYFDWTSDFETLQKLEPNLNAALAWMKSSDADPDGDGFLEYIPHEGGITNQVWKDSGDSVFDEHGNDLEAPIAVVEVQAYAYRALLSAAKLYRTLGEEPRAAQLETEARDLQERFHRAFWLEDLGTYAHALDAKKRPARVVVSNPGHALWTGIVPPEIAPRLADTMFSDGMWSGWGLRTLSEGSPRYNPVSYHNGSVWSHDNAIIALGLARYGLSDHIRRLVGVQLEAAALSYDARLSELFAGFRREDTPGVPSNPPVPYPAACHPQAWDAAAPYAFLTAALEANAVPESWGSITVEVFRAGILERIR